MRRFVTLLVAVSSVTASAGALVPSVPIPDQPIPPQGPAPGFIGSAATPDPTWTYPVPRHPFMAPNGKSNMHNDAYMTDAYGVSGPLGRRPMVDSTWLGIEECASITFDRFGRVIGLCGTIDGARLRMFDPTTLESLAILPLPPRSVRPGTTPLTDYCAAGYFYLDHRDRGVLSTNHNAIWVVATTELPTFTIERTYDLIGHVPPPDCLVSVLPDWSGLLWFLSREGIVGTVDPVSGEVKTLDTGELMANSFAVDETGGVFIVSDRALYRFEAGPDDEPVQSWRVEYDRGTQVKPGMLSQGSGTSPTLFGPNFVAIADNAEPHMNVEVYRRDNGQRICGVSVFENAPGSTTENSIISIGNALIVENNYGYTSPVVTSNGGSTAPGIARVNFNPWFGTCTRDWTSDVVSPTTVPKGSYANGLIYVYAKPPRADGTDAWYFTAIDLRSGETVYQVRTGFGYLYNNHYAPISIGPDGAAYVGSLGGLLRVADGG